MPDPKIKDINKIPNLTPVNLDNVPNLNSISNLPINTDYDLSGDVELNEPNISGQIPYGISNEEYQNILGRNQSYAETALNNTLAFSAKTVGNLVGGIGYLGGMVNGTAKAISRGSNNGKFDASKIDLQVDDFTENFLIDANKQVDNFVEEFLPNYESKDEKENPIALRNFFGTVLNTTTRDAAPFMAAFLLEGAALGKLLSMPAQASKLARIAEAGGEAIQGIPKNAIKKFFEQAPKHVVREILVAQESLLEADNGSEEVYKSMYDKILKETKDENLAIEKAEAAKEDAFKNIFLLNQSILRLSNIETKAIFKPTQSSRRSYQELAKEWSSLTTKGQKAAWVATNIGKNKELLLEPLEEVLQGSAAENVKNKIETTGEGYNSAIEAGIDTLTGTVDRLQTDEGILEAISSLLLSGPMSIRNNIRDNKAERISSEQRQDVYDSSVKGDFENISNLTQESAKPDGAYETILSQKGKELLNKAKTYNENENLKNAAVAMNDPSLYARVRDTQIANLAYGHFESGLGEELEAKINILASETIEDLKKQNKTKIYDFEKGKEISLQEYSLDLKQKIKNYEDIYNTLDSHYSISNPELRSVAFLNSINQSELRNRINKTPDSVGQEWLDYKNKLNSNKSDIDIINEVGAEVNKLKDKTDAKSIDKTIELNSLLTNYKNYKNWLSTADVTDTIKDQTSYNNKKNDKLYYEALKKQFDLITNPKTQNKVIEEKIKRDEINTEPVNVPKPPTSSITKKSVVTSEEDFIQKDFDMDSLPQQETTLEEPIIENVVKEPIDKVNEVVEPTIQDTSEIANQDSSSNDKFKYEGRNLDTGLQIAYNTEKFTNEVNSKNKTTYRQGTGEFNDGYNIENCNPLNLKTGDVVEYRKDEPTVEYLYTQLEDGYQIVKNNDGSLKTREPEEGEFSVGIYSEGKKIGNLHRIEWLLAKDEGAYRNITDNEETIIEAVSEVSDIWDKVDKLSKGQSIKTTIITKTNGSLNTVKTKQPLSNNNKLLKNMLSEFNNNNRLILGSVIGSRVSGGNFSYDVHDRTLNKPIDKEGKQVIPNGTIVIVGKTGNNTDILLPIDAKKTGDKYGESIYNTLLAYREDKLSADDAKNFITDLVHTYTFTDVKGKGNTKFTSLNNNQDIKLGVYTKEGKLFIRALYKNDKGQLSVLEPNEVKSFNLNKLKSLKPALSKAYLNVNVDKVHKIDTKFNLNLVNEDGSINKIEYKNYLEFIASEVLETNIQEFGDGYLFKQPSVILSKPDNIEVPIIEQEETPSTPSIEEFDDIEFEEEINTTPKKTEDSYNSIGLQTNEDTDYDLDYLKQIYVVDSQGNMLSSRKQDLFKRIIISEVSEDLINNKEKPDVLFGNVLNGFKASLNNRNTILSKIPEDKFEAFKVAKQTTVKWLEGKSYSQIKAEAEDFKFLVDNYPQFIEFVKKDLKNKFGVTIKGDLLFDLQTVKTTEEIENSNNPEGDDTLEVIGDEGQNIKENFNESSAEQDPRNTISWRVKLLLNGIEDTKIKGDYKTYIPFDEVFSMLKREFANNVDINFDSIFKTLKESNNPIYKEVASKLEKATERNKQLFVAAVSGQRFDTTAQQIILDKNKVELKSFDSNRNDVVLSIIEEWNEDAKTSKLAKVENGNVLIDKSKVEILKKQYQKAKDGTIDDKKTFVGIIFNSLGIKVSDNTVKILSTIIPKKIIQGSKLPDTLEGHFGGSGIFTILIDTLSKDIDLENIENTWEANNPFKGSDKQQVITLLAKIEASNRVNSVTDSFKNTEGKTIWGYMFHTYLSKNFYRLKSLKEYSNTLKQSAFSSTSKWLVDWNSVFGNSKTRLMYEDGLIESKEKGKPRQLQSSSEQLVSFLSEFQNNGSYFLPTLSDKTISPIIKNLGAVKVNLTFDESNNFILNEEIIDSVYSIIDGERKRIVESSKFKQSFIAEEVAKGVSKDEAISKLKKLMGEQYFNGSPYFFMFPELNNPKVLNNLESPDFESNIKTNILPEMLTNMVKDSVSYFDKNGIFNDGKTVYNKEYLSTLKGDRRNIQGAADITLNYVNFYGNYIQTIGGDIAQFYKKSIPETLKEYQKRFAKEVAPGQETSWSSSSYRTVITKTVKIAADASNSYLRSFKAYQEKDIDISDAQEFTTLKEHIEVMYRFGKLNEEVYNKYINKLNNTQDFTSEELSDLLGTEVLQAMKPVQVTQESKTLTTQDVNHTYNKITYIKSSSFPLIPQLTKGLEIDKLRISMEKAGVNRLAFDSAVKAGTTNLVNIFNDEEQLPSQEELTKILNDNAITLSREGFRIQQEVPYDETKEEILTVSQMNKLIFDGILDIEDFELNGSLYTGRQLKDIKETLRKKLFNISKQDLFDRLGAEEVNGSIVFNDLEKVISILREEAESRNYPVNDLASLRLENGKLIIPFSFNNSSDKFSSILNSLVTKIVMQKVPGKSFIQGSAIGMKYLSEIDQSGIIWTRDFNPEKGLQFIGKDENGKITPAQILLPFQFRDNEGNLLEAKDFVDQEGYLDYDKLPKELLEYIGARIPNQSFSSQLPIQVVGFLPKEMGDLVIVPNGITKQMGSDFDVDKLYTYFNNYTYQQHQQQGYFFKTTYDINSIDDLSKEQLQQLYKDIHWSILTHKDTIDRVVSPLDKDDLKDIKAVVESKQQSSSIQSPLYFINQIEDYNSQKSAKTLVGLSSLATTFNVTIQDLDMRLVDLTKEGNQIPRYITGLNGLKLSYLSSVPNKKVTSNTTYKGEKRTVSDNLVTSQNGFLDNAKTPLTGSINLNTHTWSAAVALQMLKDEDGKSLNLEYTGYLMSQKIIRDFVFEVEKLNSIFSKEFVSDKVQQAIDNLKVIYSNKYKELSGLEFKYESYNYNYEDLINNLSFDENNAEWVKSQLNFLDIFDKFNTVGKTISQIQSAINSDTKGVGKDMFDVLDKINKIKELQNITSISNVDSILNDTELGEATKLTQLLAYNMWGNGALGIEYAKPSYKLLELNITEALSRKNISKDNRRKIWKNFKSFLYTNPELRLFNGDINQVRQELTTGPNSLAKRVMEIKNNPKYANNLLIRRLTYSLADNLHPYDLVNFNASTADRLDEEDMVKNFLDLFNSTDEIESDLADDLITYAYVTQGVQGSNNFIKFIPSSILFKTGIRNITSGNYPMFVRQFIQNNPELAPKIIYNYSESFRTDNHINPTKLYKTKDTPIDYYANIEKGILKPYLHKYDSKTKQYTLWELNKGENYYNKISTLGTKSEKGFKEYDYTNENLVSIIDYNKADIKPIVQNPIENFRNQDNSTKVVVTDTEMDRILDSIELGTTYESLQKALKNISEKSSNESYKIIAKLLKDNINLIPADLEIKRELGGEEFLGNYDPKTNTIRIQDIGHQRVAEKRGKSKPDREEYENTIVHETLHAETLNILRKFRINPNDSLFKNNPQIANSLTRLGELFKQSKEAYKLDLEKLEKKSKRDNKGNIKYYSLNNLALGEGFKNEEEFITYSLTNTEFQKLLANLPSIGSRTILDRLKAILTGLYKAIAKNIGMEINNTVLQDVINESFNIIELQNEVKDKLENDKKYELFPDVFANQGQREAIDLLLDFLNSDNKEFLLEGKGGTGKTTIIKKVLAGLNSQDILALAPSHKAKKVLNKSINPDKTSAKISTKTLASALAIKLDENTGKFEPDTYARKNDKVPIKFAKYIIIDESSMVSDELLAEIYLWARKDAKIIFMGDKAQLPPVGQDSDSVVFNTENKYELKEKMRQAVGSPIIGIGTKIANNVENEKDRVLNPIQQSDRISKYDNINKSSIVWENNEEKVIDSFIEDFKEDPTNTDNVKIITFNNQSHNNPQSVKNLNNKVRSKFYGKQAEEQFLIGEVLTAYGTFSKMTDFGEIPIVQNSDDVVVQSVEKTVMENTISVSSYAKGSRSYTYKYNVIFLTLLDSDGKLLIDPVPVIANNSKKQYEEDIKKLWNTDKQLAFALQNQFANLEYGYVITSHKAQGSTYKNVYVMEDNIMGASNGGTTKAKNQSLYVAVSRPTTKLVMLSKNNSNNNEIKSNDTLNSLGLSIPEFMRTLSKEERFTLRTMINKKEITIKCK